MTERNFVSAAYDRWIENLSAAMTPDKKGKQRWYFLLKQEGNKYAVFARGKSADKPLGTLSAEDRPEAVAGLRRLIEKHGRNRNNSACLRLSPKSVVERTIQIPSAASDVIAPVVGNQIERITPWPEADTCYGFAVLGDGDNASDIFEVLVVATSRKLLDSIFDELKVLNVSPSTVDFDSPLADQPITLISSQPSRQQNVGSTIRSLIGLLVLVGLSAAAFGGYLAYNQSKQNVALETRLAAANTRSVEVQRLSEQNSLLRKQRELLIDRKASKPATVRLIEVMSKTLPDSAHLTELKFHGDEAQIVGKSDDPTSLITVLEETPEFENIRFAAPTTRDRRESKARFSVVGRIVEPSKLEGAP